MRRPSLARTAPHTECRTAHKIWRRRARCGGSTAKHVQEPDLAVGWGTNGGGDANVTRIVTLERKGVCNWLFFYGGLAERQTAILAYRDISIHSLFAVFSRSERITCVVRNGSG